MTDKTMPERIWAWEQDGFRDFDNMAGWKENGIVSDFEGAEYVRADLVQGNASEPLADGQIRWVMVMADGPWQILHVAPEEDDFFRAALCMHDTDGFFWNEEEVYKIGPVIRPPADTAN